jgi:hypothetical protein
MGEELSSILNKGTPSKTSSGAYPHPAQSDPEFPSQLVKQHGLEADHSPPPSAEVENTVVIPPLPITPSWRGA